MERWAVLLRGSIVALVLLVPAASAAAEDVTVVRLRTNKVVLYDCKDGKQQAEYARKDFATPWKVLSKSRVGTADFLVVEINGRQYCVKPYAVETDRAVPTADKQGSAAEGGRSGATKGGDGPNRGGSVGGKEPSPGRPAGTPGDKPEEQKP